MNQNFQSRNTNGFRDRYRYQPYRNQSQQQQQTDSVNIDKKIDSAVLINNLMNKVTMYDLVELFKNVGRIVHLYMSMNICPSNIGVAVVTFENRSQAMQACMEFEGFKIGEHVINIRLLDNRSPRDAPRMVERPHHRPVENSMRSSYNQHRQVRYENSMRTTPTHNRYQKGSYSEVQSPEHISPNNRKRDNNNKTPRKIRYSPITKKKLDAEMDEYNKARDEKMKLRTNAVYMQEL